VSVYLGKLVRSEVARRRETAVADVDPALPEPDRALVALQAVRASIDDLDDIAGRLARSAVDHGGTWEDVGSSLELDSKSARGAYERSGARSLD